MVVVQAANAAVAKETQANPVAIRFNLPHFLCAIPSAYDPTIAAGISPINR
jgi:hypothetical protein